MARSIRDRVGMPSIEDRLDDQAAREAFEKVFLEEVTEAERKNYLREARQYDRSAPYRDSESTLKEGIYNLDKALKTALGRVDDKRLHPEATVGWSKAQAEESATQDSRHSRYTDEMQVDIRTNFLYDLFLEQLFDDRVEAVSASYPTFSLVIALKAALRVLAERPALCEELGFAQSALRENAIIYFDQYTRGLHPQDSAGDFVASILYEVPGIDALADQILSAYSNAVYTERRLARERGEWVDDTPLPNDICPEVDAKIDKEIERQTTMERALVMLSSSNRSLKDIAKEYGIGHVQLSREAKLRNISRPPGRPKGGSL